MNLGLRLCQSRTRWIERIAVLDSRMDLVIAVQHFAAIINIRQADRSSAREHDQRRGWATARAGIGAGAIIRRIALADDATVTIG